MAYTSAQSGLAHRPRRSFLTRVAQVLRVRRQRHHLSELDAHMLRDIGLSEGDVAREIDRPIWDVPSQWRN